MKKFIIALVVFACSLQAEEKKPQVVVLGSGVGALTSALYIARAGMTPVVIEGSQPGGLISQSHLVQNWPGEMEISGLELVQKMREQVEANGAIFLSSEVKEIDFSRRPFTIRVQDIFRKKERVIQADACIIAMGSQPNYLGIEGESAYWGQGVTNCAVCDGPLYRGKTVAVVGGGDSALLETDYLSKIAKEVQLFVRRDEFRTVEDKRKDEILAKPNVKVNFLTTVDAIFGDGEKVVSVWTKKGEEEEEIPVDGVFLAIGSQPNTKIFKGKLKLDEGGYIALTNDQQTSVEGVFAIGDIVDPVYKQAISAAGDGAKAALQAERFVARDGPCVMDLARFDLQEAEKGRVREVESLEQFENEISQNDVPVLVDFYANWCGPCKRLSPMFDSWAQDYAGKVFFLKVNVDDFRVLSKKYRITGMPTLLMFENGKVVQRKVGTGQIAKFVDGLESNLR